jgi:hypothetical protein
VNKLIWYFWIPELIVETETDFWIFEYAITQANIMLREKTISSSAY